MLQLRAFGPNLIKKTYLVARESSRQAFYTIWMESCADGFRVCKESGGGKKVWDRRAWDFKSLDEAEKAYNHRINEKTNPSRKSKRKYSLLRAEDKVIENA